MAKYLIESNAIVESHWYHWLLIAVLVLKEFAMYCFSVKRADKKLADDDGDFKAMK